MIKIVDVTFWGFSLRLVSWTWITELMWYLIFRVYRFLLFWKISLWRFVCNFIFFITSTIHDQSALYRIHSADKKKCCIAHSNFHTSQEWFWHLEVHLRNSNKITFICSLDSSLKDCFHYGLYTQIFHKCYSVKSPNKSHRYDNE